MPEQFSYILVSTLPGEPPVGVFENTAPPNLPRQPVVLGSDRVQWIASREIVGGGPVNLGVGPYLFTTELGGDLIATNTPGESRSWFLYPNGPPPSAVNRIAADSDGQFLWTAGEPGQPIRVEPARLAEPRQEFKFIRVQV